MSNIFVNGKRNSKSKHFQFLRLSINEGIIHGCQKVLENITSGYGNHEEKY